MKKILLCAFLFSSVSLCLSKAFAQDPVGDTNRRFQSDPVLPGREFKGVKIPNILVIPAFGYLPAYPETYGTTDSTRGAIIYNTADGNIYAWSGSSWSCKSCGTGGATDTTWLSWRIDQKLDSVTTSADSTILYYWANGNRTHVVDIATAAAGGDTTIFQITLDSTGQANNRLLFAKNNRIASNPNLLVDDGNNKLMINHNNISAGGPNTKLFVKGNTIITGSIRNDYAYVNQVTDSTDWKPVVQDNNGIFRRFSYWPGGGTGGGAWGTISGTVSDQTDLQAALDAKQPTGNYITALTGDVTATGPGSVAATIANNAVANAKLAQMVGLSIKGNATNATADPMDIAAASDHQVLRRSGTSIGFGAINLASSNAVSGLLPDGNISSAATWNSMVPQSRTLTINGTAYDLSADRSWTVTAALGDSIFRWTGPATRNFVSPGAGIVPGYSAGTNVNGRNIAIGDSAMRSNTTGVNNIAIGWEALPLNTTNSSNVAIGYQAMRVLNGTNGNVAVGVNSLLNCTTCGGSNNENVAIGYASLTGLSTSGGRNVAIGALASVSNGQSSNVVIGWQATTTGGNNTVINGYTTGGSYSTIIGAGANTTGSQTVSIGALSVAGGNSAQVGFGVGRYGAGANAAIVGQEAAGRFSGAGIAAIGYQAYASANPVTYNYTGTYNTALGYRAMYLTVPTIMTGSYNTAIGASATVPDPTANNQVTIQAGTAQNVLTRFTGGEWLVNNTGSAITSPTSGAMWEFNGSRAVLFPRLSSTDVTTNIPSPVAGMVIWNTTTTKLQVYTGSAWVDLH